MVLVNRHIDRLAEDGRSPVTISTYKFAAGKLDKLISAVKVGEATPPRIDAAVRSMKRAHCPTMARQSRTILQGGLALAVMAGVLGSNPVREVKISAGAEPEGAKALTANELRDLLGKVRASDYCRQLDLTDAVTVLIGTGVRRAELLGLRWVDWNKTAGTITVSGNVVRAKGQGLDRRDTTKTRAGKRTLVLPKFVIEALTAREELPFLGQQEMIFPSTNGKWRDPNNFGKQWGKVRKDLGVPEVTSHSFRKSVADLIDEEGLSARIGADQLGHSQVSMTQNRYMTRGKVHSEVAALLDRAIKYE
jgi:integrase